MTWDPDRASSAFTPLQTTPPQTPPAMSPRLVSRSGSFGAGAQANAAAAVASAGGAAGLGNESTGEKGGLRPKASITRAVSGTPNAAPPTLQPPPLGKRGSEAGNLLAQAQAQAQAGAGASRPPTPPGAFASEGGAASAAAAAAAAGSPPNFCRASFEMPQQQQLSGPSRFGAQEGAGQEGQLGPQNSGPNCLGGSGGLVGEQSTLSLPHLCSFLRSHGGESWGRLLCMVPGA